MAKLLIICLFLTKVNSSYAEDFNKYDESKFPLTLSNFASEAIDFTKKITDFTDKSLPTLLRSSQSAEKRGLRDPLEGLHNLDAYFSQQDNYSNDKLIRKGLTAISFGLCAMRFLGIEPDATNTKGKVATGVYSVINGSYKAYDNYQMFMKNHELLGDGVNEFQLPKILINLMSDPESENGDTSFIKKGCYYIAQGLPFVNNYYQLIPGVKTALFLVFGIKSIIEVYNGAILISDGVGVMCASQERKVPICVNIRDIEQIVFGIINKNKTTSSDEVTNAFMNLYTSSKNLNDLLMLIDYTKNCIKNEPDESDFNILNRLDKEIIRRIDNEKELDKELQDYNLCFPNHNSFEENYNSKHTMAFEDCSPKKYTTTFINTDVKKIQKKGDAPIIILTKGIQMFKSMFGKNQEEGVLWR